MQIIQQTGEPGDEQFTVRLRGLTSYGASNQVLVIIDGVEGSLSGINPKDIESVSVLKDASSCAIYGARAANGVLLVTTRSGKEGPMTIEYNTNLAIHSPENCYKMMVGANSLEYIDINNRAVQNMIDNGYTGVANQAYTEEQRAYYTNPGAPNFDWWDYMLTNKFVQDHYLSLHGGTEKARYNVSLGYFDQPGTIRGHTFKKYTGKMKVDFKVNEHIEYGMNILLSYTDKLSPYGETTSNSSGRNIVWQIWAARPTYEPKNAEGNWVDRDFPDKSVNHNPALTASLDGRSIQVFNAHCHANAYLKFHFLKDFTWEINGSTQYTNKTLADHQKSGVATYTYWTNDFVRNWGDQNRNMLTEKWYVTKFNTFYSTLTYRKSLKDSHHLNTILGVSLDDYNTRDLQGSRRDFPSNSLDALSAGSTSEAKNSGDIYSWRLMSLFGRLNYNYKGRYLLEASFRYDGSSRFHPDYRWGFFPSFSGGWRVSEESFMKNVHWMDNLKFRASWGQLGNQDVGTYPYQDNINFGRDYIFSEAAQQGAYISKFPNERISWETTTIANAGVDVSILKGLVSLSFDIYDKRTSGIIRSLQVPSALGLSGPTVNEGKMKNTGYEFILGHGRKIGEIRYQIDFSGGHYKNELLKYGAREITQSSTCIREEGLPYDSYYLHEFDGIFQSQGEIDAAPAHPYKVYPGAIRLKNQNDDQVIDADDRVVADGAYPKFDGGLNLSFWYRNFDLSAFFYGVYGRKYIVSQSGAWPFYMGMEPDKIWEDAWTTTNRSNKVPMLTLARNDPATSYVSTWNLNNINYIRLKDITIGYQVPASVFGKKGIKSIRIYFSGQNLFLMDKMRFSGNPERVDIRNHNLDYPHNRIFSLGINLKL